MDSNADRRTATIHQFPALERRAARPAAVALPAVGAGGEIVEFARRPRGEAPQIEQPRIEYGSSWYHDAAVLAAIPDGARKR